MRRLGNMIDNAIEAAENATNGYIEVQIETVNGGSFLIWEVRNNFAEKPKKNDQGFLSNKKNKRKHGIGLHTVEKLVLQYEGFLQTKIIENEFIATVIFNLYKK